MRIAFTLTVALNDTETQIVETRAFEAGKPLSVWAKEALINVALAQQSRAESTALVAPAPVPARAPAIEARAPAPASEPAEPASDAEREPDADHKIETPLAPLARQEPNRERELKRKRTPKELIPKGLDRILEISEALLKARDDAEAIAGQRFGSVYNKLMRDWYQAPENGFIGLTTNYRVLFASIGQNAPAIREWAKTKRIARDIEPYKLWQAWEDEPNKPTPPTDSEAPPPPSDETIIVEGSRLRRKSLSEHIGNGAAVVEAEPLPPPDTPPAVPAKKTPDPEPVFRSFRDVDLDELNSFDGRVLRRFTERVANLGGAIAQLTEEKIALAMRKIRGSEKGDNPPSAEALVRLGVVVGRSGRYKLRPEFVNRFSDVKSWSLNS